MNKFKVKGLNRSCSYFVIIVIIKLMSIMTCECDCIKDMIAKLKEKIL